MTIRLGIASLFLLACGIVVPLLVLEGALRLFGRVDRIPVMFVEDEHTIWRLRRKVQERTTRPGFFDYRWSTNSQQFRALDEYAVPKPRGVRRVLVLGDSFTFGVGVDDSETFAALTERGVAGLCPGSRIQVVNGGVGGFGTSQELALLQNYGQRLSPDVVVEALFTADRFDNISNGVHELRGDSLVQRPDAANAVWGRFRIADVLPGYEWLLRHSALANWLRQRLAEALTIRNERRAMEEAQTQPASKVNPDTTWLLEEHAWRLTERLLVALRDTAERAGGRFVVLVLPLHGEWSSPGPTAMPTLDALGRVRALCSKNNLHCIHLADWIHRTHPEFEPVSLYIPNEWHFTRIGHAMTAAMLTEYLASQRSAVCGPAELGRRE